MFKREESRHDFAFIAGVVIGAIAGAVATLAMAPRAGTETRARLRARMEEFQVDEFRAKATESIRDAAATGSERVRGIASTAGESPLLETTRARVSEIVERAPVPGGKRDQAEAGASDVATSGFAAEVEPGEAERVFGAVDAETEAVAEEARAEAESASEGEDKPEPQSSSTTS